MSEGPAISVVLPVYRNEPTLPALHARIVAALEPLGFPFELIFVNDASPDRSLSALRDLARRDARVVVIDLPANRGQQAALRVGMAAARGRIIVNLDADLQDPPEAIPRLLAALDAGADAAYAGRVGAYEARGRLVTSWIFKHAIAALTGLPPDGGSFVAMTREVAQRVVAFPGPSPYITAAVAWAARGVTSVPVVRDPRPGGGSAYTGRMRVAVGARAVCQAIRWRLSGVRRG